MEVLQLTSLTLGSQTGTLSGDGIERWQRCHNVYFNPLSLALSEIIIHDKKKILSSPNNIKYLNRVSD
jgi:heme A synthase